MSETLIKVEGVSKKFSKNIRKSMQYGIQDIVQNILGITLKTDTLRSAEFWALKDISFELKRGECLGLIGVNGSGKSTLLKILNGIISPDKGRIEIKGKVGALIELGAGFHPMLTGRENIYINGAILGFSKKEIDKKFNEIVEFSEIEEFIDTPVKHYSSGMRVRLGFAIAAQMEPDVLLIDEVLAVGDIGFQLKCYNTINDLIKNTTVIFVSHNMQQVARICDTLLHLERGVIKNISKNIYEGIEKYLDAFHHSNRSKASILNKNVEVLKVEINGVSNFESINLNYGDNLVMELSVKISKHLSNINIGFAVTDRSLRPVAFFVSDMYDFGLGIFNINFRSNPLYLNKSTYYLTLIISKFENPGLNDKRKILVRYDDLTELKVDHTANMLLPASYFIGGSWNISK